MPGWKKSTVATGGIPEAAFTEVEKKNPGVAAAMQLSYVLGLRTKEAVQSCKSVKSWMRALESGKLLC
ncbi:integrase domain-containing protein [Escherichia coli]